MKIVTLALVTTFLASHALENGQTGVVLQSGGGGTVGSQTNGPTPVANGGVVSSPAIAGERSGLGLGSSVAANGHIGGMGDENCANGHIGGMDTKERV